MKIKNSISAALLASTLLAAATPALGADFFSTAECPQFLTFGARIGVNTSNRTISSAAFPACYHHENWGTGFDLGIVADLNIRDYLSIQPGFFFETRNGSYTLMGTAAGSAITDDGSSLAQAGNRHSWNFTIPVVASFRFNLSDDIRWSVDAGPYVAFVCGSSLSNKAFIVDGAAQHPLFMQKPATCDFGFKLGTGIRVLDHYYIGAHYMAGCVDAWKDLTIGNLKKTYGGVTKEWVFTLGYDF